MKKHSKLIKGAIIVGICLILFFISRGRIYPSKYIIKNVTHLLPYNNPQNYSGAILVNLDNEPDNEIFISVISDKNIFFKYSNGKFIRLNIPELEDADRKTFSVTACDLDKDGRDEILSINSGHHGSRIITYKNDLWRDIQLSDSIVTNLSKSYSAACIDRKGDGVYGLAVVSENGPIQYLEFRDSKIVDIANEIGLGMISQGRSILGIPGQQGFTNIFVGNRNSNFYFINKHNGSFEESAEKSGLTDKEFETRGISLIDINHDELIDIVYGNHIGPLRLMSQNRDGSFKNVTPENLASSYAVNATVVGDFNLDGYEDIYLNNIRNKNELCARHLNQWYQIDLGTNDEKSLFGVSSIAADFDHNGSMEILNTHGDGKKFPLTLYSFAPLYQYISLKIELPNNGIPRGTIVKLTTDKRDLVKSVSSGSGRFANYDDVLTFGLLKDEKVQNAEILLPSGQKVIRNETFKVNELNKIHL